LIPNAQTAIRCNADYKISRISVTNSVPIAAIAADFSHTMSLVGLLDHVLNFLLPALVVGLLLAVLGPLLMKKARPHRGWLGQAAINSVAGLLALLLGLWFFGRDGKMASYAAMLLVCASSQWFAARAWRG
jgi:hypothetical protein